LGLSRDVSAELEGQFAEREVGKKHKRHGVDSDKWGQGGQLLILAKN